MIRGSEMIYEMPEHEENVRVKKTSKQIRSDEKINRLDNRFLERQRIDALWC